MYIWKKISSEDIIKHLYARVPSKTLRHPPTAVETIVKTHRDAVVNFAMQMSSMDPSGGSVYPLSEDTHHTSRGPGSGGGGAVRTGVRGRRGTWTLPRNTGSVARGGGHRRGRMSGQEAGGRKGGGSGTNDHSFDENDALADFGGSGECTNATIHVIRRCYTIPYNMEQVCAIAVRDEEGGGEEDTGGEE